MDGQKVFKFSLREVPKVFNDLLDKADLEKSDIDLFIFHQASAVVLDRLQKKLGISNDKWVKIIKDLGNTVSATIPIAISTLKKENNFKNKKNYMLMGFGVGLSVGGCILST